VFDAVHQVARANHIRILAVQPPSLDKVVVQQLPGWEGITVREGTEGDLATFYRLLGDSRQRQGSRFSIFPEAFFARMWSVFNAYGYIKLFLAEYAGEVVCAQLAILFGDTLLLDSIGWSGRYRERHPNEVLYWEVISWAKAHGYHYCDFNGVDARTAAIAHLQPLAVKQPWTEFKLGFGGRVRLVPVTYDYIYNPLLRWGYTTLFPKIEHWSLMRDAVELVRGIRSA
jgi:lipid II:glycine glycyltransferase (peptidoglycan interpeptide bridge formation enzyme)